MTQFQPGDRVVLENMPDDPDPIPVGTKGTVERSYVQNFYNEEFEQVWVAWDNGRTLSPIVPPDQLRVTNQRKDNNAD